MPPYVVYRGKHLYSSWTLGGPEDAMYSSSQSGWMEKENFMSWILKMFIPRVNEQLSTGPVILFLDGHHSHISVEVVQICREKGVHLYFLPLNTTHVLQPLDVGVFGPLKQAWRSIVNRYKVETRAANITKAYFSSLLSKLWMNAMKAHHLQSAFRACRMFPFNRQAIQAYKMAPSLPFDEPPTMATIYLNSS
jgi:hypothetical protein